MDIDLRTGVEWDKRLARELATCRVFVPLYSRRYFHSVQCGKEWAAFDLRRRLYMDGDRNLPEVIVPVYWVPVPEYELPEMVRSIQFIHPDLGEHYKRHGLYELIKLRRFRDHYRYAVHALAQRIIEVAETVQLPPGEPCDYGSIKSAFTRDPERRFQITVVAATSDTLPEGRSAQYYGATPADWAPYAPETPRPLAELATDIVRELGFEPEIGTFHDHHDELVSLRSPTCPGVVLLDPWAVTDPRYRPLLRAFDQTANPWIGLAIPWSRADAQIIERTTRLRQELHAVLPDKTAPGRPTTRKAVHGLASFEEFEPTLRELIQRLAATYLRNVQTFPPQVPGTQRPRLWTPQNDDPPLQGGMP